VNFNPVNGQQLIAGQNGVSASGNINTDYNAWSPRVSFSYQLDKKTVVRSGYGVFFFPQGNAGTNIRQFRQPPFDFVVNQPFSGNDIPATKATDGFPIVTTSPNLTKGPALFALKGVTPNFRNGQMQQFNFSVQRELAKDMVATVGFVSSAGAKLYWTRNINQPDPGPGAVDPRRPYFNLYPGVTGISWLELRQLFLSSLQTSFEKRFSGGFYLLSNWTWSHALDNVGGDGGINGPIPQDPRNRRADWASSNSDVRHRVNIAASYQLPFGVGRKHASAGALGQVIGNWEIGGLMVLQCGLPYTVTVAGSPSIPARRGRANPVRGSIRSRRIGISTSGSIQRPSPHRPPSLGDAGTKLLNGPRLYNLDFSVSRKFRLGEARELQFRSEFFNGLNHPQFGLPNATAGVGGAGTIVSTQRANRQIQFALRFAF
jgi:hypothetical protein